MFPNISQTINGTTTFTPLSAIREAVIDCMNKYPATYEYTESFVLEIYELLVRIMESTNSCIVLQKHLQNTLEFEKLPNSQNCDNNSKKK